MAFYRVLEGKHLGLGPKGCDCDNCRHSKDEDRRLKEAESQGKEYIPRYRDHIYRRGDIVETDFDLLSLNQGARSMKFEMVDSVGRPLMNPSQKSPPKKVPPSDGLDDLTVDELKSMASEEGIDIGSETRKREIIKLIRATMVQEAVEAGFRS